MKDIGESRWMTFKAVQTIRLDLCAFEWRARAGPLGMIRVRDALEDGTGGLSVTALGLFVISEPNASAALTRAEVGWEIDGKLDICWQGQIQDWKILPRSL